MSDFAPIKTLQCPGLGCRGTMVPESRNGVVADRCERCRGVWFDGAEIDRWLRDLLPDATESLEERIPYRGTPSRPCPRCTASTETAGWSGLVLDRCPECGGLFVEAHELDFLMREGAPASAQSLAERLKGAMVSAGWTMLTVKGVVVILLRFLR